MQRYVALHGAKTYGPVGYGTLSKYTTQKEPTFIRGVSKLMLHTSGYCYLGQKERKSSFNRVYIYFRLLSVCLSVCSFSM